MKARSPLYVNLMPRYRSLCEPHMPDPVRTYVAAKEITQHAPPTSDTQFQCIERERGLVRIVQAVAEQSTSSSTCVQCDE